MLMQQSAAQPRVKAEVVSALELTHVPCLVLCAAAVDWMYWRFLEWWQPADSLEAAPDFPTAAAGGAGGG